MNTIKLFFSLAILTSSSLLGFLYGGTYGKRAKSLSDLEYCLRVLESQVVIGNTPLPTALENTYKQGKGDIRLIFKRIKDNLLLEKQEDIYFSLLTLSKELRNKYLLKDADIEVILFLGKILGKSNREDQKKNFQFILGEINEIYKDASKEKDVYEKLYRSLGILLGIGIIIIII